jgi:hypothetical protein
LKRFFSSVGASSEEFTPSAEDIPNTFKHIENEVEALDEVIAGHGDFCALLASRSTAVAFMKVGCTHGKTINKPTFSLSLTNLVDIPSEARSIGNRFITQIGNLYLLLALAPTRVGESWLVRKPEACLSWYETYTCCLH